MKVATMDPAKMKVAELRTELAKRGLDTKGIKAVLVERLRLALESDTEDHGDEAVSADPIENSGSQDEREKSPEPTAPTSPAKTPARSSRSQTSPKVGSIRSSPKVQVSPSSQKTLTPEKSPALTKIQSPIPEDKPSQPQEAEEDDKSAIIATPQSTKGDEESSEPPKSEVCAPQVAEEAPEIPPSEEESVEQTEGQKEIDSNVPEISEEPLEVEKPDSVTPVDTQEDQKVTAMVQEVQEKPQNIQDSIDNQPPTEINENVENQEPENEKMDTNEINEEISNHESLSEKSITYDESPEPKDEPEVESNSIEVKQEFNNDDSAIKQEQKPSELELKVEKENSQIENEQYENEDVEMKSSIKQEDDKDSKDQDRKDRKDRKRKRSTSSQEERHKTPPPTRPDDEPEIDHSRVLLSWYDSDLNLVIDKTKFLSATPMHNDGFGYVWAGVRASFGITTGKVFYEVKVTHECNVTLQDEEYPHVLRAGWSVAETSMQLGEERLSYGYGGTGKISTALNFKDYGPTFGLNDILACFVDFTGDEKISISYRLNGKDLGEAFSIEKADLEGKALFPHILTKNCGFVCNFGEEAPWTEDLPEDFVAVSQVEIKDRVPGPQRPEKREDCEMLMMVGLPAAGKTVWAGKYAQEHPEKMYNILGTNALIDKMKVIGLPRKRNYHGRWEVLIDKCTRCLNKLLEVAASRRRNYILDQTNVYPSAQRRKMRHFYGFQRKAIVIVPTDEELKSRTAKREAVEGKDVPDSAILDMKANFGAPVIGESFDAIEWIELDEEEGKKLIAKYNKEGKDAGYGQQQVNKRPRFEKSSDSHRDSRDIRSSRDSRDSRDHRDRRSAYSDRNRSSTWRGGSQGAPGWRDRMPRGGGGHIRHSTGGGGGGGYGSSSGGWRGRGAPAISAPQRGSDRRGPSADRRSSTSDRRVSSRQGGWGPMNSNYHNSSSSGWGSSSQSSSGWSGSSSSQQGSWGGQQSSGYGSGQSNWGSWKGYGSNSSYTQGNYGQQGYGNGNWAGWNQQQYYNQQYWGQQQPQSGQSSTTSGQTSTSGSPATAALTTGTGSTYSNYPQGWGNYTQSYSYSTDSSNPSTQQK